MLKILVYLCASVCVRIFVLFSGVQLHAFFPQTFFFFFLCIYDDKYMQGHFDFCYLEFFGPSGMRVSLAFRIIGTWSFPKKTKAARAGAGRFSLDAVVT